MMSDIDMPDPDDLPALAAWVNDTACELIGDVLKRHTEGMLKALRKVVDERNAARERVAELEAALADAQAKLARLENN